MTTGDTKLKAPFPAFGGKSKVASLVWERLGDVDNYIEPFCNSAAVLLNRPHPARIETLNDWDCYVANFWRATQYEPEAVAYYADNPVNEADMHARHRWLVLSDYAALFRQLMRTDPTFYDVRVAGWWCWGACCWIGSGWCAEPGETMNGPPGGSGDRRTQLSNPQGIHGSLSQQLCHLDATGRLVATGPKLGDGRPQLADAFSRGRGVNNDNHLNEGRPALNHRAGLLRPSLPSVYKERQAWLIDWFSRLRDRLRTVRVCCGDWIRVCDSPSTTTRLGVTGIFLDPPYRTHLEDGKSNRHRELYASDRDQDVNALVDRVIAYCLERGSDPNMRIAACCYEGEGYEVLAEHGWTVEAWKASGGYGNQSGKVNENAGRERIWFSPACLQTTLPLFAKLEENAA